MHNTKGAHTARNARLNCIRIKPDLTTDGIHRACIHAGAAVDTVVSVDSSFSVCFSDCAYRARIVTCSTVDAFVGNCMCQFVHLPLFNDPHFLVS